ncbi:sulfatase [Halococcus sp. IIIV-5B]|uniref:sulfatase family protein n=1 Tax=Halococcus sp. IIIV-5B TaxID=2321230 RepID=UPI000E7155F6|nr:sulfatase [Halococcus sp. IIIV-5B]RJT07889.1 hypothetical protein D3261_00585 [Halococcus sp. IIIV-5B]
MLATALAERTISHTDSASLTYDTMEFDHAQKMGVIDPAFRAFESNLRPRLTTRANSPTTERSLTTAESQPPTMTVNTILIDIDSLRPDHIGAYGYGHKTTPRIDEFAEDAVRFQNAYVANSPCLPSRAALISGRHGISNGVETHGPRGQQIDFPANWPSNQWAGSWMSELETPEAWYTLPELLFQHRIKTGGVSSFPRHTAPWFHRQWHDFRYPQEPEEPDEKFQTVRGENVTDLAIDLVDRYQEDEFFVYAQYWDPHGPYKRSDDEIEEFRGECTHPYPTEEQLADHVTWDKWRSASEMGIENRADLAELVAAYDAEIRYADRHVGRLLDHLRDNGLYDDSLIILTADHGEEFGEHGLYREHWSTHDGTQRVPLLLKPPSSVSTESGERSQLVTNVDIAATVADYTEISRPEKWQGSSLRPIVEDEAQSGREYLVFDHGLYTAQRAVRTGQWKYIRTYHSGMWEETTPEEQLFDMESDPWEQDNVVEDHPEVGNDLSDQLEAWTERYVGDADPLKEICDPGPAGYLWAKTTNNRWR